MYYSITQAQINGQVQTKLQALRDAINVAHELQMWLAGVSLSDLTTAGFTAADAQAIKNACADADVFHSLYNGAGMPSGYTDSYNFGASQRAILGPQ